MKDLLNKVLFILYFGISISCKPALSQEKDQIISDKFSITYDEYQVLFKSILKSNIITVNTVGGDYFYVDTINKFEIGDKFTKENLLDSLIFSRNYLQDIQKNVSIGNESIKLILDCTISNSEFKEVSISYFEGVGLNNSNLFYKQVAILKVIKNKWVRITVRKEDTTYNLANDAAWATQIAKNIDIKIN